MEVALVLLLHLLVLALLLLRLSGRRERRLPGVVLACMSMENRM